MAKISVIVPVYNTEEFLERCLFSLMTQTEKDMEFILIDDASTDHSLSIMRAFQKLDQRFKIITSSKNEGVSITRNKGLEIATGKYIGFVDSDDFIKEDYFKVLSSAIDESGIPIAVGKNFTENKEKNDIIDYRHKNTIISEGDASACYHLFTRNLIANERFVEHCRFEDTGFTLAMNMKSGKAIVADRAEYCHVYHPNSYNATGIYSLQAVLDTFTIEEYLGALVEKNPDYSCYQERIHDLQMEFDLDAAEYIQSTVSDKKILVNLLNHLQVLINKKYGQETKMIDHPAYKIFNCLSSETSQKEYRAMPLEQCDREFKYKVKVLSNYENILK